MWHHQHNGVGSSPSLEKSAGASGTSDCPIEEEASWDIQFQRFLSLNFLLLPG